MLIGNVLEKMSAESAWELCADKLADNVRSCWQNHREDKDQRWEDSFSEDPGAFPGLHLEGFKGLVGLDYIFKWWGGADSDSLAGEVDAIWKVIAEDGSSVSTYKTWIRLADRDFILGLYSNENDKRDANRKEFRKAFSQWKDLFAKI